MASLKNIRERINSVRQTIKITSAMKMVSVAKLRKAQLANQQFQPFSQKMDELISIVLKSLDSTDEIEGKYTQKKEGNRILLVALTSNKGLAGAFNSSIIKEINSLTKNRFKDKEVEILTIGKKGYEILSKNYTIYKDESYLWDSLILGQIKHSASRIAKRFVEGTFSEVYLVYNHFINAANQVVKVDPFLPIDIKKDFQTEEKTSENQEVSEDLKDKGEILNFIFEPGKEKILKELLPTSLYISLYKTMLDSFAAEHGARMTAMSKATDNASVLQNELKISYNKARQSSITNELIEIVAGAQAL